MKILQINKFFYPRRGAERYYFNLMELLKSKGHKVIPFSMQDDRNEPSEYAEYFVSRMELGDIAEKKFTAGLLNFGRMIYSREAKQKISRLLDETKPDIAHIHLIYHHISPSILGEIKKRGIPIVMTLHDYKLICPNYSLYTEGSVCERCRGNRFYNAVLHRCLKDSYLVSAAAMAEMYVHKAFQFYEKNIDRFIAPSQFVKTKMAEFGQDASKIEVAPHFIKVQSSKFKVQSYSSKFKSGYLLYFGALSIEKGIDKFLEYFAKLDNPVELRIAGDGSLGEKIQNYIKEHQMTHVKLLGRLEDEALKAEIAGSLAVVVPSVSYETFGLAVLEAYQMGKPVLASRLGALPELVENGQTGYLFDMKEERSVLDVLRRAISNTEEMARMGENGHKLARDRYNEEEHYKRIMEIYLKSTKFKVQSPK
ncbi:MAG: glycosyltransferase family 4 protein [Parcubacteria group bacterium]|nr:glycosyltransferase family 4 protein [Parcubacteria group bacterium]